MAKKKLGIVRDAETSPILDVINRAAEEVSAWPDWKRCSELRRGETPDHGEETVIRDLKWCQVGVLLGHPDGPRVTVGSAYWLTASRARALRDALTEALEAIENP